MKPSFQISPDESWIKCLVCGRISYNKIDIVHRYCGYCHQFHQGGPTVCDFCTGEYPLVHDYQALRQTSSPMPDGRLFLDADLIWAACDQCHRLVEEKNWEVLLERALDGAEARYGLLADRKARRKVIIFYWEVVFGKDFMRPAKNPTSKSAKA